jgi:hypothetical protein
VDDEGNTYVMGATSCADFPSGPSGYDQTLNGLTDVFIAKLNPNGTALLWSTFIGGSDHDEPGGIDVDGDGSVYAVGSTRSPNFPTTPGAWNRASNDAFALKLDPSGTSLIYSTFIGSDGGTYPLRVSVDASGNAIIAGRTDSFNFPTTAGAYQTFHRGRFNQDIFVLKLNPVGSDLLYSTYLGDIADESPSDLYVDGSGCAYVLGRTGNPPLPTTAGAYSTTSSGQDDVFITKFTSDGSGLVYSTLVGTDDSDSASSMVPGPLGSLWVVASLGSAFPTTPDAFDRTPNGYGDVVLFRLSATGSAIEYSTFIGGSDSDWAVDLAIDASGEFCILGCTASADFPVSELAFSKEVTGDVYWTDCFFMRLDPALSRIDYSTYFGGSGAEYPTDLLIGPDGFAYAGGYTSGTDFPTTQGAYDVTAGTDVDTREAFVTKLDIEDPVLIQTTHDPSATTGDSFNVSVEASDNHLVDEVAVEWWSGASPDHEWAQSSRVSGSEQDGTWNASIQAPVHSLEPINLRVRVRDPMGNFVMGQEHWVPVYDNDPPTFTDATRGTATTGDPMTLTVDVNDNIAIANTGLLVRCWYGEALSGATTASMRPAAVVPIGNGTYDIPVIVPSNSTEPLHYVFLANDTSGNAGESQVFTLPVFDNDAPVMVSHAVPEPATTGDACTVKVRFEDNIGTAIVRITYWFGAAGAQLTRPMRALDVDARGNGVYDYTLDVPAGPILDLFVKYTAEDASGNVYYGPVLTVKVVDNDAPSMAPQPIDPPPVTGGSARLQIFVDDNIDVQGAGVRYAFDDLDEVRTAMAPLAVDSRGVGMYVATIDVPASARSMRYWFEATDTQGNANGSAPITVAVLDVIAPRIRFNYDPDDGPIKGLDRTILVGVEDNIGVLTAQIEYWLGETAHDNLTMEVSPNGTFMATLHVPRAFDGTLRVLFSSRDEAGNWNSTRAFEWTTVNAAPVVSPLPAWQVVEGTEGTFDLSPYVSDANDPVRALTVTCNLASVRVEGLVLRLNLSAWQPDRNITVKVSDGENTTSTPLMLHVVNVNDAPVIDSIEPASGTRFGEGRPVQFIANATDEDGDRLTFTWREGGRLLGTGDNLTVRDLRPGRHAVTLEVSDGNATTSQKLVVTVNGNGGDGSVLLLLLLIVILVAVTLTLLLMRRRAAASRREGPVR